MTDINFEEEAEFCLLFEPSPAQVSELVLDGTAVLCSDLALAKLSPAQLRQLVLAGRKREKELQKEFDEMKATRDIESQVFFKQQQELIKDAYADGKATARKECEKEAEKERRNWEKEQTELRQLRSTTTALSAALKRNNWRPM
jgi:hypothetical protein